MSHASVKTVHRALVSVNIKQSRWKRAFLKDENAIKRLNCIKEYKNWTKEKFENIIFIKECMVEKSRDPKGIWVIRRPKENWYKDGIKGVTKGPGIKLMVSACIWSKNKGCLISIFDKGVDRFV